MIAANLPRAAHGLLAATLLLGGMAPGAAAGLCPAVGAGVPPVEAVPTPSAEPEWQKRAAQLDRQIAGADLSRVRMLFLGDSLTEGWEPVLFDHFYAQRAPLNLGVRGDNTQGLLWRLQRLPLGTVLNPDLIVLLIGTNDFWPGVNPGHLAVGVGEVVHQLRLRAPRSHILLVGLLPRGEGPGDPARPVLLAVNTMLAQCADGYVTFVDPGSMLLDGTGRLTKEFSYDSLHLTWIGYAVLGAGIEPYVRQVMGR